jgi:hypothetical protein
VPLVTTPVGAQGLPGLSQLVPVEDDPARFARAVVLLLRDDAEWESRCARQIAFAKARFSMNVMHASLLTALAAVGLRVGSPSDVAGEEPEPKTAPAL